MIRLDLSDDQRREWQQVSRQAVGRVALRAQMVLLCARGYRVPRIAQIHNCGEDGVRLWCACGGTATARRGSPGWRMSRAAGARPRTGWRRRAWTRRLAKRRTARAMHAAAGRGRP